jgi:hypothetical protein
MSRSALYTANTSNQLVAVNNEIGLGSIIRRYGCNLDLSGSTVRVAGEGYYDFKVSVTAAPVAEGEVTITLYKNNVPIQGATASETVAAGGDYANLAIDGIIRENCAICDGPSNITLVLSGGQANISNVALTAEKI